MPKRKALGPVESDGDDDEFVSFPSTPVSSPYPKLVPNNFHGITLPKRFPTGGLTPTFPFGSVMETSSPSQKLGLLPGLQSQSKLSSLVPTTPHRNSVVPNILSSVVTPIVAKKSRSSEFVKGMKDLNFAFVSTCRASVKSNPSHSLAPLVKDYLYHSVVLMEQCRQDNESGSTELVNGNLSPSKSFKGLGEYFEDFEQRFILEIADDKGARRDGTTSSVTTSVLSISAQAPPGMDGKSPVKSNLSFTSAAVPSSALPDTAIVTSSDKSPLKPDVLSSSPLKSTSIFSPGNFISTSSPLKSLSSSVASPSISTSTTLTGAPTVTKPTTAAPFAGFSFFSPPATSTSVGFGSTGASGATGQGTENNKNEDDDDGGEEDEEPPKNEIIQVTEDDAIYSIKCKVFGMINGQYKDKGIGMLYVKRLDGGKHQVVVRADNNLGTVILNILLQKSLPLEKKSAKDVMTVDLQGNNKKGMPILLRVKSESEATELLNKLKEYQEATS